MRFEAAADEDFDPEELAKIQKEQSSEIELIREVANAMNTLLNYFDVNFLPYFDQLLPFFAGMLVRTQEKRKKYYVFCDVLFASF